MGFRDFPFMIRSGESRDPRRYPSHSEVLAYLQDFAKEFGIEEMIRFETAVVRVTPAAKSDGEEGTGKWRIESTEKEKKVHREESYDAVVVCNGHYIEPRLAEIPGISCWPGKKMHSHNYRLPQAFKDEVVVLIGNSASADDISRDIAGSAKEVHVASWSNPADTYIKQTGHTNLWMHSMIERVHEDGSVVFQNGKTVLGDAIMHCTGYKYHFPFLDTNGCVAVDDNRVGPLYKHIFPPALAPSTLSFVGIPCKVIPFPMFETLYATLEGEGKPCMFDNFEYNDWLASQYGCSGTEEWRKDMFLASFIRKMEHPETYRDEWEDFVKSNLIFATCQK